jgi:hypothetical protein
MTLEKKNNNIDPTCVNQIVKKFLNKKISIEQYYLNRIDGELNLANYYSNLNLTNEKEFSGTIFYF